jgi:hypothetical protein
MHISEFEVAVLDIPPANPGTVATVFCSPYTAPAAFPETSKHVGANPAQQNPEKNAASTKLAMATSVDSAKVASRRNAPGSTIPVTYIEMLSTVWL